MIITKVILREHSELSLRKRPLKLGRNLYNLLAKKLDKNRGKPWTHEKDGKYCTYDTLTDHDQLQRNRESLAGSTTWKSGAQQREIDRRRKIKYRTE